MREFTVLFVCLLTLGCVNADPLAAPDMKPHAKRAVELGWKYFRDGDHDTALRRFNVAIRHDADFAPGYFGVAYVHSVNGDLENAITFYRKSLELDNTHVYTYANLGFALIQNDDDIEGIEMLDAALKIDPNCGEAHLSYANFYAKHKKWNDAEASANLALKNGQKLHPEFKKSLQENGVDLETTASAGSADGG